VSLQLLNTPVAVRDFSRGLARAGQRLALVPTMGALHDGHLALMRAGAQRADVVAATIFVNPMQFGPREDLARYPRDLEGDLLKCASAGVRAVYAPAPTVVYPPGFETHVEVGPMAQGLCGARRPGHFRGVATVVTKLLALFRPDVALFGEKDYQQLQVIKTLSRDLDLGVEIVGLPTVREPDGLAMSSRNAYLSPDERSRALALARGLRAAQRLAAEGEHRVERLVARIRLELEAAQVREDYVEVRDAETLAELSVLRPGRPARALIAGYVGSTRLIDNVGIDAAAAGSA
jgi:pantoate--beta-alanine ligase